MYQELNNNNHNNYRTERSKQFNYSHHVVATQLLNEEAGYKSAIAGSIFRDFAWHLKWSRVEKKLLSLSHYKPLPIHIFIGLTVQKSKKKYP